MRQRPPPQKIGLNLELTSSVFSSSSSSSSSSSTAIEVSSTLSVASDLPLPLVSACAPPSVVGSWTELFSPAMINRCFCGEFWDLSFRREDGRVDRGWRGGERGRWRELVGL